MSWGIFIKGKFLGLFTAVLLSGAAIAQAQDADPVPSIPAAFAAARGGDWDAAFGLMPPDQALARDLLVWTRLRTSDSGADFAAFQRFVAKHPDWPGMERLLKQGEFALPEGIPAQEVIDWFEGKTPQSGRGALLLAQALTDQGAQDQATAMLETLWQTQSLSTDGAALLIDAHADTLAPFNVARAEMLFWRGLTVEAAQMGTLLSGDDFLLSTTRLAFADDHPDAKKLYLELPETVAQDAALAYARFRGLLADGNRDGAATLMDVRSDSADQLGQPVRWAIWRRSLAREAMRDGRYETGYRLASRHQLSPEDGVNFSDLEWLSGFIALRFLDRPSAALGHFQTMEQAVDGPISISRAAYWMGRSHEVLGQANDAARAYAKAASHQTAFYGLLASERLQLPLDPVFSQNQTGGSWQSANLLGAVQTRAALTLLSAGQRTSAVLFVRQLGQTLDPESLAHAGQMFAALNEPFFAVLLGKVAISRGIVIPQLAYPLHPMARRTWAVSPDLALAVARQESEFREDAGSSAGALGLMQLMPATAQSVSEALDLPYSRSALVHDWTYNATLGTQYLADLETRFGASTALIAAAYNAGPSHVDRWIESYGDPRTGDIDIIDWIELIPFRETLNYVQRVSEAIPNYHAQRTGNLSSVAFTNLLTGERPLLRPVARPAP